jgi:hypothetical protein
MQLDTHARNLLDLFAGSGKHFLRDDPDAGAGAAQVAACQAA